MTIEPGDRRECSRLLAKALAYVQVGKPSEASAHAVALARKLKDLGCDLRGCEGSRIERAEDSEPWQAEQIETLKKLRLKYD